MRTHSHTMQQSFSGLRITNLRTSLWSFTSSVAGRQNNACHIRAKECVNSKRLVLAVGCISLFHCFIIWDTTDRRACGQNPLVFGVIAHRFCLTVYLFDFGLRCYVERLRVVQSAWNWLDIFIISAEFTSEICKLMDYDFSMGGLQALRIFKVCRFVTWFKELRMLVQGVVGSLRILFWSFILFFTFTLGWATLAVELVNPLMGDVHRNTDAWDDCERCHRAFNSVEAASLTLFQVTNAGDSWGKIAIPVIERYPATAIIFVGSQFTLIVGVLNIVIAVLVDGAAEARARDTSQRAREAQMQETREKKALEKIFRRIDVDRNGVLKFPDLIRGVEEEPELQERLRVMDIQGSDLHELFMMLDGDGSGEIDPEEFIDTLYRMRCGDDKTAATFVKHYVVHMAKDQAAIAEKVGEIEVNMQDLKGWRSQRSRPASRTTPDSSAPDSSANTELLRKFNDLSSSSDTSHVRLWNRSYASMPLGQSFHPKQTVESKNSTVSQHNSLLSNKGSSASSLRADSTEVAARASCDIQRSIANKPSATPRSVGLMSPRRIHFAMTPRPDLFDTNVAAVETHAMQEHLIIMAGRAEIDINKEIVRLVSAQVSTFQGKVQTLTRNSGSDVGNELDSAFGMFRNVLVGEIDTIMKNLLAPIRAWKDTFDDGFVPCTPPSARSPRSIDPSSCASQLTVGSRSPSPQPAEQQGSQDPEPPSDIHVYLVKKGTGTSIGRDGSSYYNNLASRGSTKSWKSLAASITS